MSIATLVVKQVILDAIRVITQCRLLDLSGAVCVLT